MSNGTSYLIEDNHSQPPGTVETAGVMETVQRCSLECDKVRVNIERWTKHPDPGKLVFWDRFLVGVWHKEKFRTFATQLQTCLNALQLAVEAAQLRAQLRDEMTSAPERGIVIQQLNELRTKIQVHLDVTKDRLADAQTRIEQLEEDHDGTPEVDQAIEEARKRAENLRNDQVASGVVFAQAESNRSGIDIGKVITSEKSKAYVGLPASVVGRVNLRVAEVGTSKESTSHVGMFGQINV